MGRIKTKLTKRIAHELMKEHEKDFKKEFNANKQLVTRFTDITSKKIRNIIAGYTTRLAKQKD